LKHQIADKFYIRSDSNEVTADYEYNNWFNVTVKMNADADYVPLVFKAPLPSDSLLSFIVNPSLVSIYIDNIEFLT
jgi:hypothetical protein